MFPGTIYGFLFSSDIANNLLLGIFGKAILETWGYMGLFLILAIFPILALILTCFFPWNPAPNPGGQKKPSQEEEFAQLELAIERRGSRDDDGGEGKKENPEKLKTNDEKEKKAPLAGIDNSENYICHTPEI